MVNAGDGKSVAQRPPDFHAVPGTPGGHQPSEFADYRISEFDTDRPIAVHHSVIKCEGAAQERVDRIGGSNHKELARHDGRRELGRFEREGIRVASELTL